MSFSERIYGERLQLDFLHRLRDEVKFESAEALIRQMHRDEVEARAWFAKHEHEETRQKAPSLLAGG
jgi:riboflavin kinase/FMN adenylyltransferase